MEFRTVIKTQPEKGLISHATHMMLLGSCFSDSIGQRLKENLFNVCVNPFGTLYNAASIATVTERIVSGTPFTEQELIDNGHIFGSWLSHSSLGSSSAEKALAKLNEALCEGRRALASADFVIITLGTSYVFSLRSGGQIVANCHKFPADTFVRSRLSVTETTEWIERIIAAVRQLSPQSRFIFTVSPIRHTADGLHGNQLSKATLLLAIDEACRCHPDGACLYFPAYEALMDDLRDYRFYDADMKHPSAVAADYIYNLFSETYFSDVTQKLAKEARALTRRMAHRPLTDDSESISKFRNITGIMADDLLHRNPELADAIHRFIKSIES